MAQWKNLKFERKQIINTFGNGINVGVPPFNIDEGELTYVMNMGSQNYPAISTRYGRTYYSTSMPTLTTPNALSERNNTQLHAVDGNTWEYWTSTGWTPLTTSLASTEAEIQDFATGTARYTILMNGTQKLIWDGSSTAATFGDANTPNTKIFTSHKGRIFAARDNDIMYSALNLPNDWTAANDSGSIDITKSKGAITGLCEYNDHVIAFTEYGMHELYGDSPSNYTLIDVEGEIGCISNRSIVKCNQKLYWAWIDGIYEYNGASPIKISKKIENYFNGVSYANRAKIVSGSIGDFLYVSIPYNSNTNNLILVYDTILGKWFIENGNFKDFITLQNVLYGVDSTGGIHNMRSTSLTDNGTEINWELITKPFNDNTVSQKKTLIGQSLIYAGSTSASMTMGYNKSVSSTTFTSLATSADFPMTGVEENVILTVPTTDLNNVDWFKYQIKGSGAVTIHALESNYRVKRR